uniref:SpoU_methylase domain-containing protein n=1 Tax=Bursaphelenchus xylophilus TaxID=6326 RepID=A0A1I7S3E5_BURXY
MPRASSKKIQLLWWLCIRQILNHERMRSRLSFGLSLGHRLKTRLVLLLLLLVKQNSNNPHKERIISLCINTILDGSQQFSIKLPVEWILTTYCMESEEFLEEWLQKDVYFGEKRIGSVVSWMFVLLRYLKDRPQRIYDAVFRMLRWITVTNFSVKCATIAVLKLLFKWHSKEMMEDPRLEFVKDLVTFNPEIGGNSQEVVNNIVKDPFFNDINSDQLDLHVVFYQLPFLCGMPRDELIFEIRPGPEALKVLVDFLKEFREGPLKESDVFSTLVKNKFSAPEMLSMIPEMKCNDFTEDFQQKIDPNENKFERNGKELVVVASLINKTANLGGLCRTCEVFGVSALVLSNENIISDQNFKALSMSAEKWIPIIEVKPDELLEFLESSKLQGYKVVAAEQTSASIPLHEFEFPDKTLILLGEEKRGVPPELIRSVDQTVEIEQFGQTRSLNVHVSASLFIYQFASQKYC